LSLSYRLRLTQYLASLEFDAEFLAMGVRGGMTKNLGDEEAMDASTAITGFILQQFHLRSG
jgi:hypothetical protein